MKVGIDILEVSRMTKFIDNDSFLEKNFTKYEIEYMKSKNVKSAQTLTGLFCSKEAFLKALGLGIKNGIELKEIEINHDEKGKPFFVITEKLKGVLDNNNLTKIDLSISHTESTAIAMCVMI